MLTHLIDRDPAARREMQDEALGEGPDNDSGDDTEEDVVAHLISEQEHPLVLRKGPTVISERRALTLEPIQPQVRAAFDLFCQDLRM